MTISEIKRLSAKLRKYLFNLTWVELRELRINAQQVCRIKKGEEVIFRAKTINRLKYLVEK